MDGSRPVIVLGAARSGTKVLRDTLGAAPTLAVVPYDVNYIWRTGNEGCRHDALTPDMCSDRVSRSIIAGLERAAGVSAGDGRRLVEKTVSNTLRLEFVAKVFPDADFVHLVRDGHDVVASSLRQWTAPIDWRHVATKARGFPLGNLRYAFWFVHDRLRATRTRTAATWGVRYEGIDRDLGRLGTAQICARQWVASVSSVRAAACRRPDLRVYEIRFEDFVRSESALWGLVEWLGLPDRAAIGERYRQIVRPPRPEPWDALMGSEDAARVRGEMGALLETLGYPNRPATGA
jgi:hypothetical protein